MKKCLIFENCVSALNFPEPVVAHLADTVGPFNDARIGFEYLGKYDTADYTAASPVAYWVRNLEMGNKYIIPEDALSLFGYFYA